MKKKVLSLVLCIAMLFSLVAAAIPAGAVDMDPRGQVYGEDLEAKPGDTIYMNYYLYNPVEEGIGGVSFRNAYDTSVMSIVEIEDKLDEQYGSTLTKAASYGKLTAWITKSSIHGDCLLGTAEIKIADDAKPGVYEFTFDYIVLTTDWYEEIEPNDAINYITIKGDEIECDGHEYEAGSGKVTPPTRDAAGKVELTCTKCEKVQTITLDAVEIGFEVPDVRVNIDEEVKVDVNVKAPATGLYGATLYVYLDAAIDPSTVEITAGDLWENGADLTVLDHRVYDEAAAKVCAASGIEVDLTGKTIFPVVIEPKNENATDNIYGEGALLTIAFNGIAAGEYEVGAVVHGALFGGYNPEWYAGVEKVIDYDEVTGAERVASGTLTVHEHKLNETSGKVTPPTRDENGKVEISCTTCGEVLNTIDLPKVEIDFYAEDTRVLLGEDATIDINVKAPETGLYGATLYIYLDEGIDASTVKVAAGSLWTKGADIAVLEPRMADDKVIANCGDIIDLAGKTVIPVVIEPLDENVTENIYGEGALVTVTIPGAAEGTYKVGAVVHGALFAGYDPEWYAGVDNVINYEVTGEERLASATLTVHDHKDIYGTVTEPTRDADGKVEIRCGECDELLNTIELSKVDINFYATEENIKALKGEDVTVDINVKAPATGLYGATLYIYLDEGIDASTVTVEAGSLWTKGADIKVFDPKAVDEKVLANCDGISIDLTGKTVIPVVIEPTDENALDNIYGDGALVTVTIPNAPVGEFEVGAFVHGALFGGYNPDWYAGVENVIEYDVTAGERLASATLIVHEHNDLYGTVTDPTRDADGKVEIRCGECDELLDTIVLPAYKNKIGFSVPDVTAKSGEEVTVSVLVNAPEVTGLYGATLYLYFGEGIVVTGATVASNPEAWENGADEAVALDPRAFDEEAAEICALYGIDFDGTGVTIIPVTLEPANATDNIYGEDVVLVTVTFTAPKATGTYDIGAIVHGELFAGYDKAWYAGIEGTIKYEVTGDERLASGTLTVDCAHDAGRHEENRVEATCTENGHYDLVCDICGEVVGTVTLPKTGHKMGEWYQTKAPKLGVPGEERSDCENCDYFETREIPALEGEELEKGWSAESAIINHTAGTIIVEAKKGALEVDYRVAFPADDEVSRVYLVSGNVTIRQIRNGVVETVGDIVNGRRVTEHDTQWKYFVSYATDGYEQHYTVKIVNANGEESYYEVTVLFEKEEACTGVEPGFYAASAVLAEGNVINVLSKEGAPEVDFRLLGMPNGAVPSLKSGKAHVIQWSESDGEYVDVTEIPEKETYTQWKYFRSLREEGEVQSYKIVVTYIDGEEVEYTVNVTFVDAD